jgi:hypothetical protein
MKRIISREGFAWCFKCKKHIPTEEFTKDSRRWSGVSQICKPCALLHAKKYYKRTQKKYTAKKIKAVLYLGNKCASCGQENLPICSFTFHHRNPEEKDSDLGEFLTRNDWDSMRKELDKCDLLCFNCHQIIHHGIITAIQQAT